MVVTVVVVVVPVVVVKLAVMSKHKLYNTTHNAPPTKLAPSNDENMAMGSDT